MECYLEQRFPHVVSALTHVWNDAPQAAGYLDGLLFKEQDRAQRRGFDLDAWRELVFLDSLLSLEHTPGKPAERKSTPGETWGVLPAERTFDG